MKFKSLETLWEIFFKKTDAGEKPFPLEAAPARVYPLTVALRIDLRVPEGTGKETSASHFIWVSPAGSSSRSVEALEVLLIPN
jgi:hypothetical protein